MSSNYMAGDLKQIVNPDLVVIAEVKGRPVGLVCRCRITISSSSTTGVDGCSPAVFRMLLQKKRINYSRVVMLGVLPEFRNSGIGGVLFYETAVRCTRNGMPTGEASWVLEDNLMMNRGAQMLNGEIV